MEFGAASRRWREAEITTRNYRLPPTISFQLLRLSFLRARIHIFGREQGPQLPLAFTEHSRVTGICRKVRCFIRICLEIEELWWILHVMDVFECAVTDCKSARGGAHPMILAEHRAIWPLALSKPPDRD